MKKYFIIYLYLVSVFLFGLPAFPGAEGFGFESRGGRGGAVLHVTNLADSGPGSLRWAVSLGVPRIIVFDVSGTIALESPISIDYPWCTIAGQTAPGSGITLKNHQMIVKTHNVIIRYIRSRVGDQGVSDDDALSVNGGSNVIIDHCSISWSIDENCSVTGNSDLVTIQYCIIGEPLHSSHHEKGSHGYNALLRPESDCRLSIHHNLYHHADSRTPRAGNFGDTWLSLDWVNNVMYNWGGRCGYGADNGLPSGDGNFFRMNYISNFLRAGSESSSPNEAFDGGGASNVIYQSGNLINGVNTGWGMFDGTYTTMGAAFAIPAQYKVSIQDPVAAFNKVLSCAGALLPARDIRDARTVENVLNYTGEVIDSQEEVGGWPFMTNALPPLDSDLDGMPDKWENAYGLNPFDYNDNTNLAPSGYTWIEEYINSLSYGSCLPCMTGTAPSVNITNAYQRTGTGLADILFIGTDAETNMVTYLMTNCMYSTNGGSNWQPMTERGYDQLHDNDPFVFSPGGTPYRFVWDIQADIPGTTAADVHVRICVSDSVQSGVHEWGPLSIDTSAVYNSAPVLSISSTVQRGLQLPVDITFNGMDAENNECALLSAEYSTNGSDWYMMTALSSDEYHDGGPYQFSSLGLIYNFVWDAVSDLPASNFPVVYARLAVTDGVSNSQLVQSAAFQVDNTSGAARTGYYVNADSGDDANPGNANYPFRTLQKAASVMQDSNNYNIAYCAGTFPENQAVQTFGTGGTYTRPLRFAAWYSNNPPRINCNNNDGLEFDGAGARFYVFDDWLIYGTVPSGRYPVRVRNGAEGIAIINCTFSNITGGTTRIIYIESGSSNAVNSNTIYNSPASGGAVCVLSAAGILDDVIMRNKLINSGGSYGAIRLSMSGLIVRNNTIIGSSAVGIYHNSGGTNVYVNNIISGCGTYGIQGVVGDACDFNLFYSNNIDIHDINGSGNNIYGSNDLSGLDPELLSTVPGIDGFCYLSNTSPAIDKGSPLFSSDFGTVTIIDIGAIEFNDGSVDIVPPSVSGLVPDMITNQAFTIDLEVDENYGYWSTNDGSNWTQFDTNGTSLLITTNVRISVYGDDGSNISPVETADYIVDTTPPAAPLLISPLDGSQASVPVVIDWSDVVDSSGLAGYELLIGSGPLILLSPAVSEYTLWDVTNGSYSWSVRALDLAGNTGAFSQTNTLVITNDELYYFSAVPYFGDARNYSNRNPASWEVTFDQGDARYFLNTTAYSSPDGGRLGEYAILTGTNFNSHHSLTAMVRTGDDVAANNSADYVLILGYQDDNNYYYCMFNHNTGLSAVFIVSNGIRTELVNAGTTYSDMNYHSVAFSRERDDLVMYYEGAEKVRVSDTNFMSGLAGVGSYNDSVYFDDIDVSLIDFAPVVAVTPAALVTNQNFTLSLSVDEDYGYWSTNGTIYHQFDQAGTNLQVTSSLSIWYYGDDGSVVSQTNREDYIIDIDAPITGGAPGSFITNQPFLIDLSVDENWGYWSTNGTDWQQYDTNGVSLLISGSLTLWYYGDDGLNTSATNRVDYTVDMVYPNVSGAPAGFSTDTAFTINLGVDENWAYWSTNGSTWYMYDTNGTNIDIYATTVLVYYGRDYLGNTSPFMTNIYTITDAGQPGSAALRIIPSLVGNGETVAEIQGIPLTEERIRIYNLSGELCAESELNTDDRYLADDGNYYYSKRFGIIIDGIRILQNGTFFVFVDGKYLFFVVQYK